MTTAMIVLNSPSGRTAGYLKTLMLEVHPNVFFSSSLSVRVIDATWKIISDWHLASGVGNALLVTPDKTRPGGVRIRSYGEQKREIVECYDTLCIVRKIIDS